MKLNFRKLQIALSGYVGPADLVALIGAALAYNGATTVFGIGWARLGLGSLLVLVYVVREVAVLLAARGRN